MDIDVKELKRSYETLRKNALELFRSLKVEDDKKRLAELEAATFRPEFWNDQEKAAESNQVISQLKKKIEPWEKLLNELNDVQDLIDMAAEEGDENLLSDISTNYPLSMKTYEELGMVYEIAQVQNNVAGAYLQMGKEDDALDCYQKALDTLHGLGDVGFRGQIVQKIKELREK